MATIHGEKERRIKEEQGGGMLGITVGEGYGLRRTVVAAVRCHLAAMRPWFASVAAHTAPSPKGARIEQQTMGGRWVLVE